MLQVLKEEITVFLFFVVLGTIFSIMLNQNFCGSVSIEKAIAMGFIVASFVVLSFIIGLIVILTYGDSGD